MYDAVVIGGGAGGLVTACILAREGRKVLVLEKHNRLGGYLQRFYREKVPFDTGFHYLGLLGPNGALRRYWRHLGIESSVPIHELSRDGFDQLWFPDQRIAVPAGRDAWRERLLEHYPGERAAIDRYTTELSNVCAAFPLYTLDGRDPNGLETRAALSSPRTLSNVLDEVAASPALREALTGQTFLHGAAPERVPFWVHALVVDSYVQEGGFGIDGGGDALADALAKTIRAHGGEVWRSCGARKIHVVDREVKGVELDTGEFVETRDVIASVHPRRLLELLPEGAFPPAFRNRVEAFEESVTTLALYFKLDSRIESAGPFNVYWYRTHDTSGPFGDRTDAAGAPRFLFLTWPSARDRSWRHPENMIALVPVQSEETRAWASSRSGARADDYRRWKERAVAPVLDALDRELPGFRGHAKLVDASSPLTQEHYTGSHEGSNYGVLQSVEQQGLYRLSPRTRVRGLYLTGQSIGLMGVLGVTITAYRTAGEIVGLDRLLEAVRRA